LSKIKQLEVKGSSLKYVSRGGLKLEKAMEQWGFKLDGKVCMDIGASTGGFTDCMLQNGARKVYSIDVGHGQLAWKLRNDERVVCMEQTNFRFMTPDDIDDKPDFASVDVSFISLTKILIPARNLLRDDGEMVCLIKPQFEAGRDKVGKNGVVREASTHSEVIHRITDYADSIGFEVMHIDFSPIKGPEGNIEYLMHIRKREDIPEEVLSYTEAQAEDNLKTIVAEKTGISENDVWKSEINAIVSSSHLI
jgi:23S rRNA (cytidine1920-2'-O)/16S rRNA (cytidine1409-2'-O)-methyltransferase